MIRVREGVNFCQSHSEHAEVLTGIFEFDGVLRPKEADSSLRREALVVDDVWPMRAIRVEDRS